jgi:hypothetical protein
MRNEWILVAALTSVSSCSRIGTPGGASDESTETTLAETSSTETETETETETGDIPGIEDDDEAPLACWELLHEDWAIAWGESTERLLLSTFYDGLLRVDGDQTTMVMGGTNVEYIWATDIDNGWISQYAEPWGLLRLVDGQIEPWLQGMDFHVRTLTGTAPDDVWAGGGVDAFDASDTPIVAHFDGMSWTTIDVQSIPHEDADNFVVDVMAVTGGSLYFGHYDEVYAWDGVEGMTLPDAYLPYELLFGSPDGLMMVGEWCDLGCAQEWARWDGVEWTNEGTLQPFFDDWNPQFVALDSLDDGTLWMLGAKEAQSLPDDVRVVYNDGQTSRRVRTPATQGIYAVPGGVVVSSHNGSDRATIECLFGS